MSVAGGRATKVDDRPVLTTSNDRAGRAGRTESTNYLSKIKRNALFSLNVSIRSVLCFYCFHRNT